MQASFQPLDITNFHSAGGLLDEAFLRNGLFSRYHVLQVYETQCAVQAGCMDRHTRPLREDLTTSVQSLKKSEDSSVGEQRDQEPNHGSMVDRHYLVQPL